MAGEMQAPVTVVGLGAMGTALAEAFIRSGIATTVWNRTPQKAAGVVEKGAVHRTTVQEAVAASPLVVTCLTTYEVTREVLEPAGEFLAGRTLVTLNSGTPPGAREMAAWAARAGARFLDGAVMSVPDSVGTPDTLVFFSGDTATFEEHRATLGALGGGTVHLGAEPDFTALYDSALGGILLPTLLGFLQGVALVTSRGVPAGDLVPYAAAWLEKIGAILPELAREVDSGEYADPASSVGIFHDGVASLVRDGEAEQGVGVDVSWLAPVQDLLRKAVADGHRDHSIAVLAEYLRKPGRST
ncbi:NAD(P)-binding domain-containing protein [Streptomyces sp. NPDC047315]|uniref:NAD(P)-dependent oxidoreductase n=1 Tax=Streptomyces sp. NPDC047315 TaxID=3155142 RepID=UPI0033E5506D